VPDLISAWEVCVKRSRVASFGTVINIWETWEKQGCLFLHVCSGATPLASRRYRSEIAEAMQLINKERKNERERERWEEIWRSLAQQLGEKHCPHSNISAPWPPASRRVVTPAKEGVVDTSTLVNAAYKRQSQVTSKPGKISFRACLWGCNQSYTKSDYITHSDIYTQGLLTGITHECAFTVPSDDTL